MSYETKILVKTLEEIGNDAIDVGYNLVFATKNTAKWFVKNPKYRAGLFFSMFTPFVLGKHQKDIEKHTGVEAGFQTFSSSVIETTSGIFGFGYEILNGNYITSIPFAIAAVDGFKRAVKSNNPYGSVILEKIYADYKIAEHKIRNKEIKEKLNEIGF